MKIFPAVDILGCKAVRLYKGNYSEKTDYGDPVEAAMRLKELGAEYLHIVDLDGAKSGDTPNLSIISEIAKKTGIFVEVGGGIRSIETVEKYLEHGLSRVIIGTAAVTNREFLCKAVSLYGDKIAVGADILGGSVRISGWLSDSGISIGDFMADMQTVGVKTVICTDISKDGALKGTNIGLYERLCREFPDIEIVASGGVTALEEIEELKKAGAAGAIIGKAYYTGLIDIAKAIEAAR
ncbi:MAG: 1-(5-phosphoribosyl)-5-[(5-phosphoribosylamino)methylideneamino]imidazole-4-carboxamide isomerase [Oscillospiraceae bacterium]|nr:1-(5-phosphoribosyl)-5-[(5-phosphoribosylamino)methylideneamino]imidazole-4-carboxamide isomerase [Oscillospiraceae bacterium]